jgi:hypothetical protein
MGELGIVGVIAFIWFNVIHARYLSRLVKEYTTRNWTPDFILVTTKALQTALIILFVQGMSGHNLFRYNWYIFACFASIMTILTTQRILAEQKTADEIPPLPSPQEG